MENNNSNAWYEKTWLVVILCILFFPVGLYALWKNSTISKGWKIGVTILIALIVIANVGNNDKNSTTPATTSTTEGETEETATSNTATGVKVGEVLKTDYFDITVNKVEVKDKVSTGNQYADLKPESGNSYLIINATFKNTDNESRMLMDGSVWINYNGKDYEFDKSETVMLEGWGVLLDQINPLTTKTTNLVYKIPSEVKGDAYWQPGRSDDDQRILLGSL